MQVSVLLTCYQHEAYIAQAIESVLAQRGVEFELLVGDDASTDASRGLIAEYARAHPGVVRTFFPERNLGQGGKPIFGELIDRSRGRYLAMLDGDDYWTSPDKLRRQVAELDEDPGCAMCFHDVLNVYEGEDRPAERYNGVTEAHDIALASVLESCVVAACSPVFRRHTIAPLPSWYFESPWGDWPLYVMAAAHGTLRYLPEVMGVYRIHPAGMYQRMSRLETLEGHTAFYRALQVPAGYDRERRRKVGESLVKRAWEHRRLGQSLAALRCLGAAGLAHPPVALRASAEAVRRRRGTAGTTRLDPG